MRFSITLRLTTLLLSVFAVGPLCAQAPDEGWARLADENGITLFMKHLSGNGHAYKATASLSISFKEMASLLTDANGYADWLYGFSSTRIMAPDPDGSVNLYLRDEPQGDGKGRDIAVNVVTNVTDNMCIVRITGRPGEVPVDVTMNRADIFSGYIVARKEPDGGCKITFQTEVDWGHEISEAEADYSSRMLTLGSLQTLQRSFGSGVARQGR